MNTVFHQWRSVEPLTPKFLEEFDRWSMIQKDWLEKSKEFKSINKQRFSIIEKSVNVRSFMYSGQIEDFFRFDNDPERNRGITENIITSLVSGQKIEHELKNISEEEHAGIRDLPETSKRLSEHMKDYFQKDLDSWFIKGLHELSMHGIVHYEGRDSYGNFIKIPLKKGDWKKTANSVNRGDGQKHEYCPPEQVQTEIEKLLALTNSYLEKVKKEELNPVAVAGFLHHRFTQIHPFPDGNGRVARLLMNFILIKFKLLPIIINPDEKNKYYEFLEKADKGDLEAFIQFLRQLENGRIQNFYNSWESQDPDSTVNIEEYGSAVGDFLKKRKDQNQKQIESDLGDNLDIALVVSEEILESSLNIFAKKSTLELQVKKYCTIATAHYFWRDILGFVQSLNGSDQYFIQKSENNCAHVFRLQYTGLEKGNNTVFELVTSFHEVGRTNQISICPFLQIKKYTQKKSQEMEISGGSMVKNEDLKYYLSKPFFISADEKEASLKESLTTLFKEVVEKFVIDVGQYLKQNV